MNTETHHNPAIGESRKRKAPLTHDHDNNVANHSQPRLRYAPSCINGCASSSSGCFSCARFHYGRQEVVENKVEDDFHDSLPVGYQFKPTDEELIAYLLKKINKEYLPKTKINETSIYKNHPKAIVVNYPQAVEGVWYFFTPRVRKYPNGDRPDRRAGAGYWKATGPDKVIKDNNGVEIGGRKALVYHKGHAPKWTKTKWMMHEYVVYEAKNELNSKDKKFNDLALCKIYTNKNMKKLVVTDHAASNDQLVHLSHGQMHHPWVMYGSGPASNPPPASEEGSDSNSDPANDFLREILM